MDEQLAIAERELLEARATYTIKKKATRTVLMTDPILKAVHRKANTPLERFVVRALKDTHVSNRISGPFYVSLIDAMC